MIGTILIEARQFQDKRDPIRQYKVTGETRASWLLHQHYDDGTIGSWEVKIDKKTMLGRGQERPSLYLTPEQYDKRLRRAAAVSSVQHAASGYTWATNLSDEQLNAIAEILKIEGYVPC